MGWLEISLLAVAAMFMAVNQAVKDATALTAWLPWLKFPGWLNYAPLVLIVVAICILLGKLASPANAPPSVVAKSPVPRISGVASSVVVAPPIVVTGLPVSRVMGFYEGRTMAEADRLAEPFIGAKANIQGVVSDVEKEDGVVLILLRAGSDTKPRNVFMRFESRQSIAALRLAKGEHVKAECYLRFALEAALSFKNCRIRP